MNDNTRVLLSKLKSVKRCGSGWSATCPAHDDQHASLTINEAPDGTILINCHKGCDFEDITRALGMEPIDFFPEDEQKPTIVDTYDYVDEEGNLLYQVVRWHPKSFTQRVPDGKGGWINRLGDVRRTLYRVPKIQQAIAVGDIVFVVEGEKDVHTLEGLGMTATCSSGGAQSWRDNYADLLAGARIVVLPDNDPEGVHYADTVARTVRGKAESVKVVELPGLRPKQDITDWVNMGHTKADLLALVSQVIIPNRTVVNLKDAVGWLNYHTEVELPPGIEYPWPELNKMTSGLRPGWLTFWAGYTSHGKTASALEISEYAAHQGHTIFLVSGEMGPEEIAVRMAQRRGLDTYEFYSGKLTESNKMAARATLQDEACERIHIAYTKSLAQLEEYIGEYQPSLLIVDYLQLLDIGKLSRVEGTTQNSQMLKDVSRRYQMPVLCLSQVRRPDRSRPPEPPTLNDLRDSGAIENAADQVIFVYQEPTEVQADPVSGQFIVAKSRMGLKGITEFAFFGSKQIFSTDPLDVQIAKEKTELCKQAAQSFRHQQAAWDDSYGF